MPANEELGRPNGIPHEIGRGKSHEPVISFKPKEGVHMDRLNFCLMFILVCCFLSGCNNARVSSSDLQQASINEDRAVDQKDPEKVPMANGRGEVGKSMEISNFPEQGIDSVPFVEERFVYRPTRAGGMPTIQNPKGVPYPEKASLLVRE
jgi:hypothetical protein